MNKLSINLTANTKSLSSYSGLHLFLPLIDKFELRQLFGGLLPRKSRERGFSSFQTLTTGILRFIAGADRLDSLDDIGRDPLFNEPTGSPSAITMGKFLRSFTPRQVEQIRGQLPTLAFKIWLWFQPNLYKIIFKMDGSLQEQYGEKMEGVEWNYKKFLTAPLKWG